MKMKNLLMIGFAIAGLAFAGCGDDDTVQLDVGTSDAGGGTEDVGTEDGATGGDDTGVMVRCPSTAPAPMGQQMGACCSRMSNADRLDSPEFRISGLDITTPASLNSTVIKQLLQTALNDETFNWLIDIENAGTEGSVDLITGFGRRQADGTFTFDEDGSLVPSNTTANLTGNTLVAEMLAATVVVPVVDTEGTVVIELPLRDLTLSMATWDDTRTCMGNVRPNGLSFDNSQAQLSAFITVEAAKEAMIDASGIVNTLCNVLRGQLTNMTPTCDETPQADWQVQPDGLCDETGCSMTCDGATTCNAWLLSGGFAAQGVEIND